MRARDLQKIVGEYHRRFPAEKNNDAFAARDIDGVYRMSHGQPFDCICNALNIGYIVGYRHAQRDYRKRKKAEA